MHKDPAKFRRLVQLQDKIVDRFALTIYPYSLEYDFLSVYYKDMLFSPMTLAGAFEIQLPPLEFFSNCLFEFVMMITFDVYK